MFIVCSCECGRSLRANPKLAGRWVKCPACSRAVLVPGLQAPNPAPPPMPEVDDSLASRMEYTARYGTPDMSAHDAPRPVLAPPPDEAQEAERSWRGKIFWLLLAAMVPLAIQTFTERESALERIHRTLDKHPEIAEKVGSLDHMTRRDEDRLFQLLPDHRIEGALVGRDSWIQWPWAMAAGGVFLCIVCFAIPGFPVKPLKLLLAGLFTGTGGVLALLAIQFFGLFCFCVGGAYLAALDPRAPFGASLIGFFFGVGFCEEMIKSLPVLYLLYNYHNVSWRMACVIGMASGAGFGISEGIHYASNQYNGIATLDIYLLRFSSCVAFHTILSGICAIFLQRKQHLLNGENGFGDWIMTLMAIISPAMLLHGLFDTMVKKGLPVGALCIAILSFVWLAYLIKQSRERERVVATVSKQKPKFVRTAEGTRYVGE